MSSTSPALIAAAAGVGFGHAVLPDHWVPLSVLGRTQRYPLRKVARLSGLAGVTHVLVSVLLGGLIIAIGLQFRSSVEHAQDTIIGSLLIATGLVFAFMELTGRGHGHSHEHDHDHDHDHEHGHDHAHGLGGLAAVIVPFGAAASPDLTILPVFLAATAAGTATAVGSVIAFAAVTIGTIVGLTVLATVGGYQVQGAWLDRWGNLTTAGVLIFIGGLIVAGVV